jgi:hypothetical protein
VRSANVRAAIAVANLIKTSLGPVGLDKMLVDEIGDVTSVFRLCGSYQQPLIENLHLSKPFYIAQSIGSQMTVSPPNGDTVAGHVG